MTTYTLNYRFALPDYNVYGWGDAINSNFSAVDTLLAQFTTTLSLQGLWKTGNMYAAGVSVIDALTGHIWYNAVSHTSVDSTFAAERAAYPTYWTDITNPAIPANAAAATATAAQAAITAQINGAFMFRNRLINGAMQINQRTQTTYTTAANGYLYTLDRWLVGGTVAITVSKGSVAGFRAADQLKLQASINAGGNISFGQRIESLDIKHLVGQKVTLSFDATMTSTNTAPTFFLSLTTPSTADNYPFNTPVSSIPLTPLTSSIATYSYTFDVPANADKGLHIALLLNASTTTSVDLAITAMQLEAGTLSTGFERIPIALESVRCQRFFQLLPYNFFGYAAAGGTAGCCLSFLTSMRANPTAVITGAMYSNSSSAVFSAQGASSGVVTATVTSTGNSQSSGILSLSAEL